MIAPGPLMDGKHPEPGHAATLNEGFARRRTRHSFMDMVSRLLTFVTETSPRPVTRDRDEPRRIEELDRIELLTDVLADDAVSVPAGSVGTVVAIWAGGAAFEVEFTRPVDALATVDAAVLRVVGRAAA